MVCFILIIFRSIYVINSKFLINALIKKFLYINLLKTVDNAQKTLVIKNV